MKERFDADCPLCGSTTSYEFTDAENFKAYACPDCGIFEVSTHAERLVKEMPQERRAFYVSLIESAPADKLLEISFEVLSTGNRIAYRYISARR